MLYLRPSCFMASKKTKKTHSSTRKRPHMSFPFWADGSRHLRDDNPRSEARPVSTCAHPSCFCRHSTYLAAKNRPSSLVSLHVAGGESTILHPSMGWFTNVYSSHPVRWNSLNRYCSTTGFGTGFRDFPKFDTRVGEGKMGEVSLYPYTNDGLPMSCRARTTKRTDAPLVIVMCVVLHHHWYVSIYAPKKHLHYEVCCCMGFTKFSEQIVCNQLPQYGYHINNHNSPSLFLRGPCPARHLPHHAAQPRSGVPGNSSCSHHKRAREKREREIHIYIYIRIYK